MNDVIDEILQVLPLSIRDHILDFAWDASARVNQNKLLTDAASLTWHQSRTRKPVSHQHILSQLCPVFLNQVFVLEVWLNGDCRAVGHVIVVRGGHVDAIRQRPRQWSGRHIHGEAPLGVIHYFNLDPLIHYRRVLCRVFWILLELINGEPVSINDRTDSRAFPFDLSRPRLIFGLIYKSVPIFVVGPPFLPLLLLRIIYYTHCLVNQFEHKFLAFRKICLLL